MPKPLRVKFTFDERSLGNLKEMIEQSRFGSNGITEIVVRDPDTKVERIMVIPTLSPINPYLKGLRPMPTETNKPRFTEKQAASVIHANSTLTPGMAETVAAALRNAGFDFAPEPKSPEEVLAEDRYAETWRRFVESQNDALATEADLDHDVAHEALMGLASPGASGDFGHLVQFQSDGITCASCIAVGDDNVRCDSPSRFIVERSDGDKSYGINGGSEEACDKHLAEAVIAMLDGNESLKAIVTVRWDSMAGDSK